MQKQFLDVVFWIPKTSTNFLFDNFSFAISICSEDFSSTKTFMEK